MNGKKVDRRVAQIIKERKAKRLGNIVAFVLLPFRWFALSILMAGAIVWLAILDKWEDDDVVN